MKVVVIGTGYVASAYLRVAHFLGFHPIVLSRKWVDYYDYSALKFSLSVFKPDLVINAAGYTGNTVDDCETNRSDCYAANVFLPYIIGVACKKVNATLIHISSGCIYDGLGPFTEDQKPNFITNYYQQCKVLGELEVKSATQKAFVFRIRMPFNQVNSQRNWLMKLCQHDKILDGLNSVTFLDEFAMRSFQLVQKAEPGIYHCAESTPVWTSSVAKMLFESGLRKKPVELYDPYEFNKNHIPRSAAVLDCTKFETAYGCKFGDPLTAIRWCIDRLSSGEEDHDRKGSIYAGYH